MGSKLQDNTLIKDRLICFRMRNRISLDSLICFLIYFFLKVKNVCRWFIIPFAIVDDGLLEHTSSIVRRYNVNIMVDGV
ncbi:hypothetical protein Hanom_Chr04g00297451 [Helianthus anomalus]